MAASKILMMTTTEKIFRYKTAARTVLGDLHTPVAVYMRLRDLYPQSALMESSDYHARVNGRSFIGMNPVASIAIGHGQVTTTFPDGTKVLKRLDPSDSCDKVVADFLARFSISGPESTLCGLFGYTSFNMVAYFEHISIKDETLCSTTSTTGCPSSP